ncbi:50S ribosomal protein P1 [Candidatus Woesearchaeota archaeon]|nr:50S ribosomal protein P1 [Candidatus Woesearchaeota archaeon]
MEYIYSALLIHKLGAELTTDRVKKVVDAAGGHADDMKARALLAALDGVNIDEVVKQAAIPVAAPTVEAKTEAKKEEKKSAEDEKKSEEAAAAGLGALFG